MKHLSFLAFLFTGTVQLFGQNEVDIYRYSNTINEGSARFEAMAGSFGALGAEGGSARINPAGFGRYSNSTLGFSMSVLSTSNNASFQGVDTKEGKGVFRVPSMQAVFVSDISSNRSGFLFWQVGVGYNRVANFFNEYHYEGQQYESLLDGFASQAQGVDPVDLNYFFPFSSSMAYETYCMDYDGNYYQPRLTAGDMYHDRTITTKGGINEYYFSLSANYLNKLYVGANIGFQTLKYTENTHHNERLLDYTGVSLRSFDYDYNFTTKGNGANVKIGAIYLPTENMRFGLALHSPTSLSLLDKADANMRAVHDTGVQTVPESLQPSLEYKYTLVTPARIIGSYAIVFNNKGCINIDAELLDYRWGKLKSTTDENYVSYDFKAENNAADMRFKTVVNLRIGGEMVIRNKLFIRGGYGFFPIGDKNQLVNSAKFDQLYSGGLGLKWNQLTLEFAVKYLQQLKHYEAFSGSAASIKANTTTYVLGLLFKLP
ncbi:MAG: hypothetical protein IT221_15695 [Fluviicola sp.]|nr:hypothetical protein [Fluviicola sp.]